MSNAIQIAALAYADRGWRVVPLRERDKMPWIRDWVKAASTDVGQVAAWWSERPGSNVGVALGSGSEIVAVDIDSEAGEQMVHAWAGDRLEPTLEFTTGKGRRLLYAIPDSIETEPTQRADFKDPAGNEAVRLQGKGGQCVMPPSIHPTGKLYAWVQGRDPDTLGDPAPMPAWLIDLMCRPEPAKPEPARSGQVQWADQAARSAFAEGASFNELADWWKDILEPAGFKAAGIAEDGVQRYTRPGKSEGISATVGHYRSTDGAPALYVFSGSIPQLAAGKCYDKFGAFARLHCAGDFARAAQELSRRGFPRPRGPKPAKPAARTAVEPAEWGEPIPLYDATEAVEPWPLDVFPGALGHLIARIADSVLTPPDYAAAHALAVAAGAIGGAFDLQIKRGYYESTNLFVCTIAPSGSGKSPTAGPILEPIHDEQSRRRRADDQTPVYVEDTTTEKLAAMLDKHPRGLLMAWDEMSGWIGSFNQYKAGGQGSDRAHYLSIWDGRPLKVDRKSVDSPPVFVRRPRLSVVGGIQPGVLDSLRKGPVDGLFERLLFTYPTDNGMPAETWAEVPHLEHTMWKEAVSSLWQHKMHEDRDYGARPNIVLLREEARPIWQAWTEELHALSIAPDQPAYFRPVAAKIRGSAARIALVIHLLREAYGECAPADRGVGAEDMEGGVRLARYFLAHASRVFRRSGRDPRVSRARAVLNWAAGCGRSEFTRHDAWAGLHRNSLFDTYEDLGEPMRLLAAHRCIRWREDVNPGSVGRPKSGIYEVNPRVLTGGE